MQSIACSEPSTPPELHANSLHHGGLKRREIRFCAGVRARDRWSPLHQHGTATRQIAPRLRRLADAGKQNSRCTEGDQREFDLHSRR